MGFECLEPRDLAEACAWLAERKEEIKIIAGGQSLMILLKRRLFRPEFVVNIKGLSELAYVRERPDGVVSIGALTTHRTIETSPLIAKKFPMLVEMEHLLAGIQIRNWGTIGGNLCHADPSGDPGVVLTALGARVKAQSIRGTREISLEEFFVDYLETVLSPDEVLTEINVSSPSPKTGGAFIKESVRFGDPSIVSAAAVVTLDGEIVKNARIVLGAVGNTQIRAKKSEELLRGKKATDLLEEVAKTAANEAKPSPDIHGSVEHKRQLVTAAVKAALNGAIKRAEGG